MTSSIESSWQNIQNNLVSQGNKFKGSEVYMMGQCFWGVFGEGRGVLWKLKFVFCCIAIKFRKNAYKEFIKSICSDPIISIVVVAPAPF